jgi:hypothetical protein
VRWRREPVPRPSTPASVGQAIPTISSGSSKSPDHGLGFRWAARSAFRRREGDASARVMLPGRCRGVAPFSATDPGPGRMEQCSTTGGSMRSVVLRSRLLASSMVVAYRRRARPTRCRDGRSYQHVGHRERPHAVDCRLRCLRSRAGVAYGQPTTVRSLTARMRTRCHQLMMLDSDAAAVAGARRRARGDVRWGERVGAVRVRGARRGGGPDLPDLHFFNEVPLEA